MLSIGLYLIKCCVYTIGFYIPFWLFLRHSTFFTVNRIYLVSGLLLSFVLPLHTGSVNLRSFEPPTLSFIEPFVGQADTAVLPATDPAGPLNIVALLIALYLVGTIVRLLMLTYSVRDILKLKNQGKMEVYRNVKIVIANIAVPFSFLNHVFLPTALVAPGVLEHELAHVRQRHWLDLLMAELASIILWFNPIMIVYRRALKQQHEYLADRSVISSGVTIEDYLTDIRQQFEPSPLLTNGFSFHSIKNRIHMLTKKRTPTFGLAAYTIALPVIFCLLVAFSPRKHLLINISDSMGTVPIQTSLGLPIDRMYHFSLVSGYGERLHPVLGVMRMHTGIDLAAEEGVPVSSTEEGVVIKAHLAHAWGNIIVIQHNETYSTSYSHLKSMNVKKGEKVRKGQVIGLVGHTGLSEKNHLHFELYENGVAIDPMDYLPEIR